MFSFFKNKNVDNTKVNTFCLWFKENNERIIESVNNSASNHSDMMRYLNEVELQLSYVYRDGYKKNIEFEYGFNKNQNKWELNLFHLNNRFLIQATNQISRQLNDLLAKKWIINTSE